MSKIISFLNCIVLIIINWLLAATLGTNTPNYDPKIWLDRWTKVNLPEHTVYPRHVFWTTRHPEPSVPTLVGGKGNLDVAKLIHKDKPKLGSPGVDKLIQKGKDNQNKEQLDSADQENEMRKELGLTNTAEQKPWSLGVVPYYLDHQSYDGLVAERVRMAMNTIEEASCVQFRPLSEAWNESPWVHITNPSNARSCDHDIKPSENSSAAIVLSLGLDCLQRRDILHSLMHALGFKDEVTHPQRDQFVRIKWDNIQPNYRTLFHIDHEFPTRSTEYDPQSIMHFHDRAFTKNGEATIASMIPGLEINPSFELSPLDKMKLRLLFDHECNRRKVVDLVDKCVYALQPNEGDDDQDGDPGNRDNSPDPSNRDNSVELNGSAPDVPKNSLEDKNDENAKDRDGVKQEADDASQEGRDKDEDDQAENAADGQDPTPGVASAQDDNGKDGDGKGGDFLDGPEDQAADEERVNHRPGIPDTVTRSRSNKFPRGSVNKKKKN